MDAPMKLPLKLAIELLKRVEDKWYYEITVMVPGADRSKTIALMECTLDGDAKVLQMAGNALDALEQETLDQMLVRLFKLAWDKMLANDGSSLAWLISDISRFLQNQFISSEAASISFAIGHFVNPELVVRDEVIVRID
jgi:hypothetical protein